MHAGRRRGKRLLELVIVIAIIRILLAISAPCYVRVIKKARGVAGERR